MKREVKIFVFVLFIVIFIFIIIGLTSKKEDMEKNEPQTVITSNVDNVKMEIKDVTRIGGTVIIVDNNEQPYVYEEWFRIDKKENTEWKQLVPIDKNYTFNSLGWIIGENKKIEHKTDWSGLYGTLKKGEYRLVKKANNQYIYAKFTIN